ncbi:MAG: hypothetical protein KTR30_31170 [Saprospiraceae bacterium]|nr:hypothetical protein [Saprospiraceae bacterium]
MRELQLKMLLGFVCLLFFTACQKEETQPIETPLVNPFEEAGILHNQILDEIIAMPNVQQMDQQTMQKLILNSVNAKYPNTEISYDARKNEVMADYFEGPYEMLLELEAITATEYEYLKRIEKAMQCCPGSLLDELEKILKDILSIPGPFIPLPSPGNSNGETGLEEGAIVLITEAIARHSFQYWQKQAEDPESPWKNIELASDQLIGACPGCNIGGADAAGAGSAAVYTWWTGPFSLGATVATGVGASAGQALWELASWIWD